MAAGATYTPLATTTGTGSSTRISFTSIPQSYTDLILVAANIDVQINDMGAVLNSDTGNNYSRTRMTGNGSTATSNNNTSNNKWYFLYKDGTASTIVYSILNIMNYSNSTTYKSAISRYSNYTASTYTTVQETYLWRDTAAITRIDVDSTNANFSTNCKFTLYGIAAA